MKGVNILTYFTEPGLSSILLSILFLHFCFICKFQEIKELISEKDWNIFLDIIFEFISITPRAVIIGLIIVLSIIFGNKASYIRSEHARVDAMRMREKIIARNKATIEKIIAYFEANKNNLLAEIQADYDNNNYHKVINKAEKYLPSNDPELLKLNKLAKNKLEQIRKKERTQKILAELKKIPVKEYEKNKELYEELLFYHPNNAKYKAKIKFYSKKLAKKKKKKEQTRGKSLLKSLVDELVSLNKEIFFAKTALNVRSGAGIQYKKIGTLKKYQEVSVLEKKEKWFKVKYGNQIGWACKDYLVTQSEIENLKYTEKNSKNAKADERFKNWAFENLAVTDIAINRPTLFVTLTYDKYTNKENVQIIAETIAKYYCFQTGNKFAVCRVYSYNGTREYAKGTYNGF
jgi:hypothetical protein